MKTVPGSREDNRATGAENETYVQKTTISEKNMLESNSILVKHAEVLV